jgi:hypothetical protein
MANNIALFKKYIDNLDEVYKLAAVTSILDGDASLTQMGANTNEIVIPKMTMDGLADYSRNGGYVSGSVKLDYETVKFNYDRGRSFNVDNMDNEETAGLAFGQLAAEFIRTMVAPEIDAFRFAQYAVAPEIGKASGTLENGSDVLDALADCANAMDEAEVPSDQRYLFITPTLRRLIDTLDTYKSKDVLSSFSVVAKVPQSRFYTAIDLLDGTTTGEEAGGFKKAADAKDINFMVVHKPALMQYTKHVVNKVISPAENQEADAWKFFYRSYGLTDTYENKAAGIYLHHKA